jgi:hypothetical protein
VNRCHLVERRAPSPGFSVPRFPETHPISDRIRASSKLLAVWQATSQKAREVAHPSLFWSTFKDKPALYFPR